MNNSNMTLFLNKSVHLHQFQLIIEYLY